MSSWKNPPLFCFNRRYQVHLHSKIPGASHVQFSGGGGGIRLVDNDVHEKHVAKWNSQFLQEQWTYLSKRHAFYFFCHAYIIPVYEPPNNHHAAARSPERHRSELEEVTHRAAKSLRFHSEMIKSSAGSIHSKPRWWLNQPIWNIWSSKWVHLPQIRVKTKQIKTQQTCGVFTTSWC